MWELDIGAVTKQGQGEGRVMWEWWLGDSEPVIEGRIRVYQMAKVEGRSRASQADD